MFAKKYHIKCQIKDYCETAYLRFPFYEKSLPSLHDPDTEVSPWPLQKYPGVQFQHSPAAVNPVTLEKVPLEQGVGSRVPSPQKCPAVQMISVATLDPDGQ